MIQLISYAFPMWYYLVCDFISTWPYNSIIVSWFLILTCLVSWYFISNNGNQNWCIMWVYFHKNDICDTTLLFPGSVIGLLERQRIQSHK